VREIEKQLYLEVRDTWQVAQAVVFCNLMVREGRIESKSVGFLLLKRYEASFERPLLSTVESWLTDGLCANWAAVDDLCLRVLTPLVRRHPTLIPRVRRWSRSRNLWLRRSSLVAFVPIARHGERLDIAYAAAAGLCADREDLIHKAVGWLLREAGRTDMPRLEAFLLRQGPRMHRTSVRYAIERFPPARRRELMDATRATRSVARRVNAGA
jgi:3-methyladenine DNA glycosylase AlkD